MTGREWAIAAAVVVALLIHLGSKYRDKIHNPSPPPPGETPATAGEQGKHGSDDDGARGDMDHGRPSWEGDYIPPEPPDLTQPTRVGWYEDDVDGPGRTHIHWVSRQRWEAAQADAEDAEMPWWRRLIGL